MIVRILGGGQYDVPDSDRGALDALDVALNAAVEGDDEAAFANALADLIGEVRRVGSELAADTFTASDLVVPFSDATLVETKALLAEPGGDDR
jgi:hypothetical protein